LIVFTVIEYENICIAVLNRRARYWELSVTVDAETPELETMFTDYVSPTEQEQVFAGSTITDKVIYIGVVVCKPT
jgi:hypothetical protein